MAKIGRNDPCPCGSGKKYKQCCLAKHEAAASAAQAAQAAAVSARRPGLLGSFLHSDDGLDELTEASNAVVDLIQAGKLDAAELAAHDLLVRFPDAHDGYDRLGMVCEAKGDHRQAADYYRKVIAFLGEHPDDYDPAFAASFRNLVERLDPHGPKSDH
jgi:tetratricopeptide (TPR) repeat protein